MKTNASIIICTRNRAESLRETLASLAQTQVPPGWRVELLVVDNGSTDHTRQVVESTRLDNLILRYTHEPKTGQCHARNTGLRETTGEIIMFTDDDVRVPPQWIGGMCRPITEGRADAVAGGIVLPPGIAHKMSKPPLSSMRAWFACSDYLDPERPTNMIGANMTFHRRILAQVPEFDVALGPGALGFFDEVHFWLRAQAAGFKLAGALDVAVEHHFDLSRITRTSLLELARKMGRSRAYLFHHWEHKKSPRILLRLGFYQLRLVWARATDRMRPGGKTLCSYDLIRLVERVSFCQEYLVQRKSPPRYTRNAAPA